LSAAALSTSAFVYGALSSVGPCAGPRLLALTALDASRASRWAAGLAWVAGSAVSYALVGAVGSAAASVISSPLLYWLLAAACACGAAAAFAGDRERECCERRASATASTAFVAGFAGTIAGAGCCGPIALVFVQAASAKGAPFGAAMLALFALGQGLPTLAVAAGCSKLRHLAASRDARSAIQTVSGGLLLALGAYYGMLA
jgi:cytochrome c biogenesis protein CcdA